MPRTRTLPTPLDLRRNQAREALAGFTEWLVTSSPQDALVLLGRLAADLERSSRR